jgi:hypothetical protein
MSKLDRTDDEHPALVKKALDIDRYPLSPMLYSLRAILEKLAPSAPREPRPYAKVYAPPKAQRHQRA